MTGEPVVVLLTGVMAADTVADLVAARLERAALAPGDACRGNALAELPLRRAPAGKVADGYAAAGFSVVRQRIILGRTSHGFPDSWPTAPCHRGAGSEG